MSGGSGWCGGRGVCGGSGGRVGPHITARANFESVGREGFEGFFGGEGDRGWERRGWRFFSPGSFMTHLNNLNNQNGRDCGTRV